MIVVTGATGQLGQHVVEQLLKKVPAKEIAVAVRNPDKAAAWAARGVQVRHADYNKPESWSKALAGAQKVLLISGNEIGKRSTQHGVVIQAAKKAGVGMLAYTSILKVHTSKMILAKEHLETEAEIMASGLPYVFLRNGWYFENNTENLQSALQHGVIAGCSREGRIGAASRADYAAAAVAVLTEGSHNNKAYELAGDKGFTLHELAAEVSHQSGKAVKYQDMSQKAYEQMLVSVGLPDAFAHILADASACTADGALEDHSGDLRRLVGRPTTTLQAAVQAALAK